MSGRQDSEQAQKSKLKTSKSSLGKSAELDETEGLPASRTPLNQTEKVISFFAVSFMNVDGVNRMKHFLRCESTLTIESNDGRSTALSRSGSVTTDIEIVSEDGRFSGDKAVMRAKKFEENVLPKITTLEESHMLLRRSQAVLALASRLMAATDEQGCLRRFRDF